MSDAIQNVGDFVRLILLSSQPSVAEGTPMGLVLNPAWQAERINEIHAVYLQVLGREGFESLARPHEIL